MKKNFKKSFIQALIGTSPLLLYILAFIFFPEKTVEFAEGIRTLPDRIGEGNFLVTIVLLAVLLAALSFYDLYWKVRVNRKKIVEGMPFTEMPTGRIYKQIKADIDKETKYYSKKMADMLLNLKKDDSIDLTRAKTLMDLHNGLKEKDRSILNKLNSYCEMEYKKTS